MKTTLIYLMNKYEELHRSDYKTAYDVIKGRIGQTINGVFVKSEDL